MHCLLQVYRHILRVWLRDAHTVFPSSFMHVTSVVNQQPSRSNTRILGGKKANACLKPTTPIYAEISQCYVPISCHYAHFPSKYALSRHFPAEICVKLLVIRAEVSHCWVISKRSNQLLISVKLFTTSSLGPIASFLIILDISAIPVFWRAWLA